MESRTGAARHARNGIRYVALGVVVLAAWNFFAPHVGAPSWAPYLDVLPIVLGETERDAVFVNATHIAVLFAAGVVIMKV